MTAKTKPKTQRQPRRYAAHCPRCGRRERVPLAWLHESVRMPCVVCLMRDWVRVALVRS